VQHGTHRPVDTPHIYDDSWTVGSTLGDAPVHANDGAEVRGHAPLEDGKIGLRRIDVAGLGSSSDMDHEGLVAGRGLARSAATSRRRRVGVTGGGTMPRRPSVHSSARRATRGVTLRAAATTGTLVVLVAAAAEDDK
jgi:hypothetical protein